MKRMSLSTLLEKEPCFRTKQVCIREDGSIHIDSLDGWMEFGEMMQLRIPVDPKQIAVDLRGKGHVFANLGVAVALTTEMEGTQYLVASQQDRCYAGDTIIKLLGGYVGQSSHYPYLFHPARTLKEEIAEELLLVTKAGIVSGLVDGAFLPRPYRSVMKYDGNLHFSIEGNGTFQIPGVPLVPIIFDHKTLMNAGILYETWANSALIVYSRELKLPKDVIFSLDHAEEQLNIESGRLEVKRRTDGILLIPLEGNSLGKKAYTYQKGNLIPMDASTLFLAPTFAHNADHMNIRSESIPFLDYRT